MASARVASFYDLGQLLKLAEASWYEEPLYCISNFNSDYLQHDVK